MHADIIIVGQGLAGSLLAWHLMQKRVSVAVIDDRHRGSSSLVAAGIINPISGKRLVKSWNVDYCLPVATHFYRRLESAMGTALYHHKPLLRLFNTIEERELWRQRRCHSGYQDYLGAAHESGDPACGSHGPLGGFDIRQAGYLDTKALLYGVSAVLRRQQCLVEAPLDYADIHISDTKVSWKDISAHRLVFCEGHRIRNNPWFSGLPLQPAQGEILTLQTRQSLPDRIINRGKWLLPIAENRLKIGATFQWRPIDGVPTANGKQELLDACPGLGWNRGSDKVIEHVCGVRPGTRDKKPFMGSHALHPRLSVFNGFGAKGSLLIPYYAALFADYLCGSTQIPGEVDIRRFGPC
jgi:glycine oxidase